MTKHKLYDNCAIYDNDGKLLYYVSKRKMEFYIRVKCVDIIDDHSVKFNKKLESDEPVARINIEPKKNECVICGCTDDDVLIKFYLFPTKLKKHLPENIKRNLNDTIILICNDHHSEMNVFCEDICDELFEKHNINKNDFSVIHKTHQHAKKIEKIIRQNEINVSYNRDFFIEVFGKMPSIDEMNKYISDSKNIRVYDCRTEYEYLIKVLLRDKKLNEAYQLFKDAFVEEFDPENLQYDYYNDHDFLNCT